MKIITLLKTDRRAQIIALLVVGFIIIYLLTRRHAMNIASIITRTAKEMGMPANMQALILAQARHETANFTSNAYHKNKNLFGYKYVSGARYQQAAGITSSEGNAYASYASYEDSVRELCAWIRRRQSEGKFPSDLTGINAVQYASLLKQSGYYGDSVVNYTRGLEHYLTA